MLMPNHVVKHARVKHKMSFKNSLQNLKQIFAIFEIGLRGKFAKKLFFSVIFFILSIIIIIIIIIIIRGSII